MQVPHSMRSLAVPREYLVATFAEPDALLAAVTRLRAHGLKIYDVYAPCPVHGLDEAMGLRRSRLPYVTLVAGGGGGGAAVLFPLFAPGVDWALNVRRKPGNPTPAVGPLTFEITVLAPRLATAGAF